MHNFIIFLSIVTLSFLQADDNVICPYNYHLVNNKCWQFFSHKRTQDEANHYCLIYNGGVLATSKNAIDNRALVSFVNQYNESDIWLGLNCTGLSKNSCEWDDQTTDMSYSNFAIGSPNDDYGNCIYFSTKGSSPGQWTSAQCSDELPYVCELPPSKPDVTKKCDYIYNNNCYFLYEQQVPFAMADIECQQGGYKFSSVHSYLENRFIASNYMVEMSIWLGGVAANGGLIVWSDGSQEDYGYSTLKYGNGSCVSMITHYDHTGGEWITRNCSDYLPFLCKRPVCSEIGGC